MKVATDVLAVWSMCTVLAAQNAAPPLAFEVASIKHSAPDDGGLRIGIPGTAQPGGRWRSQNATLERIIRAAYPDHALTSQLTGGPDWVQSTQFDITASAASPTATADELRAMARHLLRERFKLVLRTELRETSGYALVPARADRTPGSQLRAAAMDCDAFAAARQRGENSASALSPACNIRVIDSGSMIRIVARGAAMRRLANLLGPRVDAPVVDATGLTGFFDFSLEFANDVSAKAPDAPSIFTALQEQLGLRLERRPAQMEVLVIESVERPTPD
jgi:uncharacterized protein (TIGR03435 family)